MRHNTTPLFYELSSTGGGKYVAITPAATTQPGTFAISGIDPFIQDMRNYLCYLFPHLLTTLDADAAGSAVSWDKLYKGLTSVEFNSPVRGTVFPHRHTLGAWLGHLIGFVGLGYLYPQGARTQIPTNTDADYTVDLFYCLPMANETLADPMETANWAGFDDGGSVEMIVAPSTVYDGDYAGAVTKAPTTLRCTAMCLPSQREFIGIPNQWRLREITGGGTSPTLKNVGGETSLNGIAPGAGLAGLWWGSNATGIGLGGPDGVDNITGVAMNWRGQKFVQNMDPWFFWQRIANTKFHTHVAGVGTAPPSDCAFWPATMDSAGINRPSANAQQMFFPFISPGVELHTSKVQRVLGDLQVDMTVTDAITGSHWFQSWELLEYTESQANSMATLGRFRGTPGRKNLTGKGGKLGNFRYTAIEFNP